jgi:hypothetical protein
LLRRYGSKITAPAPKRTAVMSQGVRLVVTPSRAATIHDAQMLTNPMP